MSIARRFVERAATALVSMVATGMTIGGAMLAGMGATLRQTSFEMEGLPVITAGLMALGAALAVAGIIGAIAIWVRPTGDSATSTGPRPLLLGAAAALPLLLATQLGPLITYWRDIGRLADQYNIWESANGPSALVFVPAAGVLLVPALEAIAAIVVALTCAVVVLLMLVRSAAVLKLSAIAALLVGGLCGGSWIGVAATERLVPAVETFIRTTSDPGNEEQARLLTLLERHRTVGSKSAWTLSWGWMAVALLAVATRTAVRPGRPGEVAGARTDVSLEGLDEVTREQALLDAADRLYRNTPPRRF